jgi:hypothetical protein
MLFELLVKHPEWWTEGSGLKVTMVLNHLNGKKKYIRRSSGDSAPFTGTS